MALADAIIERIPPQNTDAEQAVLGACLLDNSVIFTVSEFVRPEDFYLNSHRLIFAHMQEMAASNTPCDLVTLVALLKDKNELEQAGGVEYIIGLPETVPSASYAEHYARLVAEKAAVRALIHVTESISAKAYSGLDAEELLDEAEKGVYSIASRRLKKDFVAMSEAVGEVYEQIMVRKGNEGLLGVPTFRDLDYYLSGLQKGDLILLAARPGMGKTSMALNIAQNAACRHGLTVGVFSLEMPYDQLVQRMLCSEAKVDQSKARSGHINAEEDRELSRAMGVLGKAKLYIDDSPMVTVMEMRAKTRKLKAETGLDLLVVDYLQLMSGGVRAENRQQEIAGISRALKALAKELDIPVLALSQLSRLAEQQSGDKVPNLSHLRESGALEQDADVVLFIHIPEKYDPNTPKKGIAEIHIAKHRNGPVGKVDLAFLKQYTLFQDLARNFPPEGPVEAEG